MEKLTFDSKIKLSNGVEMPIMGYSTELVGRTAYDVITQSEILLEAIEAGYRRFETVESPGQCEPVVTPRDGEKRPEA